jgi:hypothetical protein
MNKQDLMREVEKLTPSERDVYDHVRGHAKNLADALAFAKGTMKVQRDSSVVTISHNMADPELQAQVDHLLPIARQNFELVFFHQGLGRMVPFDEAMAIAKSGKIPDADAEHVREGYRDRLTNAWKGTE